MKREADVRKLLIDNAIHLIGIGGFEKATTKELTHCGGALPDLKMNESYIYRLFGSKEQLYDAAFIRLDNEVFLAFRNGVEAVGGFEHNTKEKLREFFMTIWRFILEHEESCRCYVRYYYSIYFKGKSLETHRKHFEKVIADLIPLFKEEADADSILHTVFNTLLDFGIRTHNGELEDNEVNRTYIFNVLYCMMMTYFKDSVKEL